jgi:hypothetical protein
MGEVFEYLVAPVLELPGFLYAADERPAARRFTIGCGILVLLVAVVLEVFLLR